jgi:putative flavoprotein involved in K+ transport
MAVSVGTEPIDTIIIGAGQAGLSAGYHLAQRGLPFVILDADQRIGDHWRERWDSLRLYSPARFDALPGMPFPADAYHYPSAHEMADYLESYARVFALPVLSGTRADAIRPAVDGRPGYVVSAGSRSFEASQVIVATGSFRTPSVPKFADQLDPRITQLHSSDYRRPEQLADGPVLVVGLSHSGADIALEAARTHPTILSGRSHGALPYTEDWRARIGWPLMEFVAGHLLTIRTPIGRKMRQEIRKGGGPLLRVKSAHLDRAGVDRREIRTVGVRDGKPLLADGTVLDVATVVWCTGFRQDYGWIKVDGFAGEDGWPVERRGVVSSAPGLYVLGVPFTYAFTSMLVGGAGRDAGYVVDRIAERVQRTATAGRQPAVTTA